MSTITKTINYQLLTLTYLSVSILTFIKPFDEIIKVVKDLKRIDISKLDGIVEWFDELLHKYQHLTKFSDTRINRLCIILNRQINKLKRIIESK